MTKPWRALAISAHPDDIEFGSAGTLARWVDEGAEVTYCIATDGTAGTQDRELMGKKLHDIRLAESEAAAAVVGAKEIVWLNYPDGYVEYTLDLRRDIARVFRKYRPHRLVVLDPTPIVDERFINHPDHRAVGQASLDVSMTAGTTPGIFPELLAEGLDPWRGLIELWIASPAPGSVVVDISDTIERKIEALMAHESQVGANSDTIAEWVRTWTAQAGKPAGFAHAESFTVLRQGPGFHAGEQETMDWVETPPPLDLRSSPS